MAAHSWKGKRSWRMRNMVQGFGGWVDWVEEHKAIVCQTAFPMWVWKRYCDKRLASRYAAEDL